MDIKIQPIDFEKNRHSIVSLLKRNRTLGDSYPFEERYDWLYLNNPHGKATGWMVVDEDVNQIVGFTVALPRLMSVSQKRFTAWNCADFSIDPKYRTLGIAAKLRRGAKNAVDSGDIQFLYAHPNEKMLAVHKRVGHSELALMRRYAKLLNVESKADSLGNFSSIAKAVSPAANQLLNCVDKLRSSKTGYDVEICDKMKFGDEFTHFYNKIESNYAVWGVRDESYLNWRYYDNPVYSSNVVTARGDGEIVGFIIFTIAEQEVLVKDIVASETDAIDAMVSALSRQLRNSSGCSTLSFIGPESHPYLEVIQRLGFHKRPETSSIIVHASPNFEWNSLVGKESNWFMTVGDRDE